VQPIHELLSRIRWDTEFARGRFELGYHDRFAHQIVLVPLHEVRFPEDVPGMFELLDDQGESFRIPFHRVREVRKDGQVIWQRPGREATTE
jgi:uncharacterized protein (UPF0248 family)